MEKVTTRFLHFTTSLVLCKQNLSMTEVTKFKHLICIGLFGLSMSRNLYRAIQQNFPRIRILGWRFHLRL